MSAIWFGLVALMLAVYVLLDGFDLGVGILHLGVARNDAERRAVISTVGPVWDANEVWLLASGGTLYFAFPTLYASAFSGFYLPLTMVLWLLILRGISLEFRSHVRGPVWSPLCDAVFCCSSALLAISFGAALGNVVRGVPLDASGSFFEPLWTNFRLGPDVGVLDWYTILVGLAAYFALAQHGALWLALKTAGATSERARRLSRISWAFVAVLTVLITYFSFEVQPHLRANLSTHPWGFAFPGLALAGLAGVRWWTSPNLAAAGEFRAFLSSCAYLAGMLTSVTFGLFPLVLPARGNSAYSLTIENAKAGDYGLKIGLIWWIIGMALASAYFVFVYRHFAGKTSTGDQERDSGHESY
jgi:cytochrome bd ubiquinol oxidase subunit II